MVITKKNGDVRPHITSSQRRRISHILFVSVDHKAIPSVVLLIYPVAHIVQSREPPPEPITLPTIPYQPECGAFGNNMAATTSTQEHAESSSYTQSGFCTRMGWGTRPVLLLIDVCKAYWTPGSPLDLSAHPAAAAAPASMRRLLAAARASPSPSSPSSPSAGTDTGTRSPTPVIWTAVEYTDPHMRDAGLFWAKARALDVFRTGDPRGLGGWVDDELTPREGDGAGAGAETVVRKKYASGFFGTTLASELACLGADTVVICGVSTSGCVRATALDAMQNGYRPMVSLFLTYLPPARFQSWDVPWEIRVSSKGDRQSLICSVWYRLLILLAAIGALRFTRRIFLIWTPSMRMLLRRKRRSRDSRRGGRESLWDLGEIGGGGAWGKGKRMKGERV